MYKIDINADVGESYGAFKVGEDDQLLPYISSANIACGFHAGDYNVMHETIELAKKYDVGIGAHPGFPDIVGFGRREMQVGAEEVYRMVLYQLGAISGFCKVKGVQLRHVKPHGALYNIAARDRDTAEAIAQAVKDFDCSLILFGLANSELITAGDKLGLTVVREAFGDRTYTPDGYLTPRRENGAVIEDDATMTEQVLRIIKDNSVVATDGSRVPMMADTICFHGDGSEAVAKIQKVREQLKKHGVVVKKVGE